MKKQKHNALTEQIPLFLDEHVLLNGAVQDLQALRLEDAKKGFEDFRGLYPHGESVDAWLKLTDFLIEGLAALPAGGEGAAFICRLWTAFEDFTASLPFHDEAFLGGIKRALFRKVVDMLGPQHLNDELPLIDRMPVGYVFLQAGQYDRAVLSLQAALPQLQQNAPIYGYLGDAYGHRGDAVIARSCYVEAWLIDPQAIDWRTFQDMELTALKQRLQDEDRMDPNTAVHWLPAHAYIAGLLRPKLITQLETLKTFVDEYLQLERAYEREAAMPLGAGLFFRGIILCDNEAFLRMVKGIDFADIRLRMKEINAPLFAAYMQHMQDRIAPRSERRRY